MFVSESVTNDAVETMVDLNAMVAQTSPEVVFELLGQIANYGSVEL
jgi:hypothetical protein